MHLGRICLLLVLTAALFVVQMGVKVERLLIGLIAVALCLGLLDGDLQPQHRTATKHHSLIDPEPEEPDEGRG